MDCVLGEKSTKMCEGMGECHSIFCQIMSVFMPVEKKGRGLQRTLIRRQWPFIKIYQGKNKKYNREPGFTPPVPLTLLASMYSLIGVNTVLLMLCWNVRVVLLRGKCPPLPARAYWHMCAARYERSLCPAGQ